VHLVAEQCGVNCQPSLQWSPTTGVAPAPGALTVSIFTVTSPLTGGASVAAWTGADGADTALPHTAVT
jgi:hypothetical protein